MTDLDNQPTDENQSSSAQDETDPMLERPPAPKRHPDPEDIDLSQINTLVIKDDAGGMAIIGVMMRFLNVKAYINTTGEGVIQMAKAMRPRPDIVFCDINLPRTDGYEVLKELRSDPELKDTTVIAITAQDADTEIPGSGQVVSDRFNMNPSTSPLNPLSASREGTATASPMWLSAPFLRLRGKGWGWG